MIYNYKAVSQSGEIIEGIFDAEEESDVIYMLKASNYMPIKIEKDISADAQINLYSKRVSKKDLSVFCRQFFTMLDAGIGIVNCIDILEKQSTNKVLIKSLGIVHEDLQKGFTLSRAMEKHKDVFTSLLVNMIEAGEVSGNLDTIMERMAINFEKENKIEKKIKSAMIYPAVLSVVAVTVVVFLLVAVLPTFIGIFATSGQMLPLPTRILIKLSDLLKSRWYFFIGGIIVLISSFIYFKRSQNGNRIIDGLKLKIPILKGINQKIITSRFTRNLSTLMASGMSLLESIELVGKVVGNTVVQDKMEETAEEMRTGIALSTAISDMGIFPPMVDSMLKIGEESGSLDTILYKTADYYDDEVDTALQNMASLMEPLMLVVMSIVIGFIVIAMAMPMFDMVNTI